tara:strand:+ start:10492 stop:11499 length:1008 start_codon:yes stop_codon:yes gene_type:complete
MAMIALVLTVKNEERLLRSNLLYHQAIGIRHVFVYFDNTTDAGKESIRDLDFVTIQDSLAPDTFAHLDFLEKFTSKAAEHHTARQCLHTYDAMVKSETMGMDWLISLDADELVCTSKNTPSQLPQFFSDMEPSVELVYLQTLEVLAQKLEYGSVFLEETLFKTQPSFGSRFQNITKAVFNPVTKKEEKFSYWFGQHLGKGAIRLKSGSIPHNVHRYVKKDGTKPVSVKAGFVLHYHAYDAPDFIKKFTNFSDRPITFLSGTSVNSLKLLFRDVVNNCGMSQEELYSYFANNVQFSPKEVQYLKKNKYLGFFSRTPAPLTEITSVQQVFQQKIKFK